MTRQSSPFPFPRLAVTIAAIASAFIFTGSAQAEALPKDVPPGTRLVVADQNEALQTLMRASGEHDGLAAEATYANFLGGPAILEAFRAGALDLASGGNVPPVQAQAAGETIPIVAAVATPETDYIFAVRPELVVNTFEEFKGKKIAYAEGSGRQAFVLKTLKLAGLTREDVELVPLRVADFPDAIRSGQVDIAPLNEPHLSRYLADYADRKARVVPKSQHDRLPRAVSYLYASGRSLEDPTKAAAIRDFVSRWIVAKRWAYDNSEAWINAYHVGRQKLSAEQGRAIVESEGKPSFPVLSSLIDYQQGLVDIIHEAGDIPKRLDAKAEFDLRFDEVIAEASRIN